MNYSIETTVSKETTLPVPILYQVKPLQRELNPQYSKTQSATSSRQAYKNYMRRFVLVLLRNSPSAKITVQLNFLHEFSATTLKEITKKTHRHLGKDKSFAAFFINEITTNGFCPVNRIHRHYILKNAAGIEPTRQVFYEALSKSDLVHGVDYTLTVKGIEKFKGLIFYICKYGKKWEKDAILFVKNSGIPKYGVIGKYFLDVDGNESKTQSIKTLSQQRWQRFRMRYKHIELNYPIVYQKLSIYSWHEKEQWVSVLSDHSLMLLEASWQRHYEESQSSFLNEVSPE